MRTFAELDQIKAEGKRCENCALLGIAGIDLFCLSPDNTRTHEVPKNHCCRWHTDKLPENLESNETTQNRMV